MDHEVSPRPRKLSSGIPRSTAGSRDTSRETSPTRGSSLSRFRRSNDRPPLSPASRPVMAQKMLQQSREAECALADALVICFSLNIFLICSDYLWLSLSDQNFKFEIRYAVFFLPSYFFTIITKKRKVFLLLSKY